MSGPGWLGFCSFCTDPTPLHLHAIPSASDAYIPRVSDFLPLNCRILCVFAFFLPEVIGWQISMSL